jgi:multidrug efflux system membrane fusion protein
MAISDKTRELNEVQAKILPVYQRHKVWIISAVVIVLGYVGFNFWTANQKQAEKQAQEKAGKIKPVTVAQVVARDVPVQIKAIGNVEALSTVQIKSQVTGQLQEIHFKEGEFVKKGDLLFVIDPRQYQAQVAQAQANLAKDAALIRQAKATVDRDTATLGQIEANYQKDMAQYKFAETESSRYGELVTQGAVSHEQFDQMTTNQKSQSAILQADLAAIKNAKATIEVDRSLVENAQASLKGNQALLQNAQVWLGYCYIYSPIDGRTGSLISHLGDMIKANDIGSLVTINQVVPIYVSFSVPEQDLARIRQYQAENKLAVRAHLDGRTEPLAGKLSFFDNAVDATTGTIRLKGTFANLDHKLWPGQFVNVTLDLAEQKAAIMVPSQAVQVGQKGQYVFVVKPDSTIDMRTIKVDRNHEGFAVVSEGLNVGETVVTDGQLQLIPGTQVRINQ